MPAAREVTQAEFYADRVLYCEHCLKIVPKQGGGLIPLRFNPVQKRLAAVIDLERRNGRPPRIVILKSRRVGASTMTEAELFREVHLQPHKQGLVVAHDSDSVDTIFKMSKLFYDQLPPGMKPELKYETKKMLHFAHNGSRMQVITAKEARGYTAQYVHVSELAFIEDPDVLMRALMMTVPRHVESLVVAESTPNGVGNYFHNLWVNAVAGRNEWVPFFSPWFEDPESQMTPFFEAAELSPHDAKLMEKHKLTLRQIAWYVWTRENTFNGDQRAMDQECASDPISCFLASGSPVFDRGLDVYLEDLERARQLAFEQKPGGLPPQAELEADPSGQKHALIVRAVPRGRWRIYRPPQPRMLYVAAADPGSGEPRGDYTPIEVLNRHTMDLDAVFYARLPPDQLAELTASVAWWYNRALAIWDAANHGILFTHTMVEVKKYPHIYWRKVNEDSVSGKVTDKPGFWATGAVRNDLYNLPRRYVREHSGRMVDPDIIKEMSEMHYDDAGRPDHPKDGYNDGVSALALALYAHMGSFEGTLAPLSLETVSKAVTLYRDNQKRRSMGLKEEPIDLFQLTMDQIEAMDRADDRRRELKKKSGLGGYR